MPGYLPSAVPLGPVSGAGSFPATAALRYQGKVSGAPTARISAVMVSRKKIARQYAPPRRFISMPPLKVRVC